MTHDARKPQLVMSAETGGHFDHDCLSLGQSLPMKSANCTELRDYLLDPRPARCVASADDALP